jgi:hypothetical protein
VSTIHNQHKRMKVESTLKTKKEFETNFDDDEDDMVGPKMDLFVSNEEVVNSYSNDDHERKRKENSIYNKVRNYNDEE